MYSYSVLTVCPELIHSFIHSFIHTTYTHIHIHTHTGSSGLMAVRGGGGGGGGLGDEGGIGFMRFEGFGAVDSIVVSLETRWQMAPVVTLKP